MFLEKSAVPGFCVSAFITVHHWAFLSETLPYSFKFNFVCFCLRVSTYSVDSCYMYQLSHKLLIDLVTIIILGGAWG